MSFNNGRELYYKGVNMFQKGNYEKAKSLFEMASIYFNYQRKANYYLTRIDIKKGIYSKARKSLEECKYSDDLDFIFAYGLLEYGENNFESSKKHLKQCSFDQDLKMTSLLMIANIHMQYGEYDQAIKILERLKFDKDASVAYLFNLSNLYLRCGETQKAYDTLLSLDDKKLSLYEYNGLQIYSLTLQGLLGEIDCYDENKYYSVSRFFDQDDQRLLKHIENHKDKNQMAYFFKKLDFDSLIEEIKNKVPSTNAVYDLFADKYYLRSTAPVGIVDKEKTSDLCVVTLPDMNKIITMYPVKLSDEFDREGFSTNEKIKIKRA